MCIFVVKSDKAQFYNTAFLLKSILADQLRLNDHCVTNGSYICSSNSAIFSIYAYDKSCEIQQND